MHVHLYIYIYIYSMRFVFYFSFFIIFLLEFAAKITSLHQQLEDSLSREEAINKIKISLAHKESDLLAEVAFLKGKISVRISLMIKQRYSMYMNTLHGIYVCMDIYMYIYIYMIDSIYSL
jgi:hypothetical protein